jgi:hypothetical protein
MAEVVNFARRKAIREALCAHHAQPAACCVCGREWVAVFPCEREPGLLQCPSCGQMSGQPQPWPEP